METAHSCQCQKKESGTADSSSRWSNSSAIVAEDVGACLFRMLPPNQGHGQVSDAAASACLDSPPPPQAMFSSAVHHPIISLFSSTGSDPLALFSTHLDDDDHSIIHFLHDARSEPPPPPPARLLSSTETSGSTTADSQGYTLDQTVLHLQGPDLRRTFIHCPPYDGSSPSINTTSSRSYSNIATDAVAGSSAVMAMVDNRSTGSRSTRGGGRSLGIRHPWVHLQVRNLGKNWSFEVGIVDHADRMGVLRMSTFQVRFPELGALGTHKSSQFHLEQLESWLESSCLHEMVTLTSISLL